MKNPFPKTMPWQKKTKPQQTQDDKDNKPPLTLSTQTARTTKEPINARATRQWKVQIGAATKSIIGSYNVLVPTLASPLAAMGFLKEPRLISLEIHHVGSLSKTSPSNQESIQSVNPMEMQRHLRGKSIRGTSTFDEDEVLKDGEYILVRVFKQKEPRTGNYCMDAADSQVSASATHESQNKTTEFMDNDQDYVTEFVDSEGVQWVEFLIFDLDDCQLSKAKGPNVEIRFGRGSETEIRYISFESLAEAESFFQIVGKLGRLEAERTKQRVQKYYKKLAIDSGPHDAKTIQIVIEIVSAIHLPAADLLGISGDPYVVVRLGRREVHTTKPIGGTLNPIWTVDSDSTFVLTTTPEEFFASSSGLTFIVKNYDTLASRDEVFGLTVVTQEELLEGTGDRMKFPIEFGEFEAKDGTTKSGNLFLRYRLAKPQDLEFTQRLREFQEARKMRMFGAETVLPDVVVNASETVAKMTRKLVSEEQGVYWEETFVPPKVSQYQGIRKMTKKDPLDPKSSKLLRVKPDPDPERPEETMWMKEEEIEAEAQKPSTRWTETGSGELGKLFVEVIGCDGLPNLDQMPLLGEYVPELNALTGGKTDAFCCMCFEDSIVNTDVINDTLCPRWMPWSQRAFVFHVFHPSSQLMVGVFDFDTELPGAKHDHIGRVTVDISNFSQDTVYTLYYNLYTSDLSEKRSAQGQIKLRLRVELNSARDVVLASLDHPPPFYINVATYRDYETARFTVEGQFDASRFDINTLTEHVDELREYEKLIPVVREALFTVLLWRGHFALRLYFLSKVLGKEINLLLPLHSISLFTVAVILAEHYSLLPSFILFGICWLLVSMSGNLSEDPNPWRKPFTFFQVSSALVTDQLSPVQIKPYENKEAIEKYDAQIEDFKKQLEEAKKKEAEAEAALDAFGKTDDQLAANDAAEEVMLATKKEAGGISMNPLEPYLFPLQQHLHQVCVVLRIARSYITWQEPLAAYWMCIACLICGVVFLFVPWGFLIRWTIRIVVWLFLGPWMKLLDIFYIKGNQTEQEGKAAEAAYMRKKLRERRSTAESRQIKREEMTKLKYLKRYMFGQYLLELPGWKESRYVDVPLMASSATPFVADETTKRSFKIADRKFGQHISGSIIPERAIQKAAEVEPFESGPKYKQQ